MKQTILNANQSRLLENLIVQHGQIVTSEQIYLQAQGLWDQPRTKKEISKLTKNGWLMRIKRGLYAISDLSNRGFLSLSPYVIAQLLVEDSYVSFESALSYHAMFDQLNQKIISISQTQFRAVELESIEYSFVKVTKQWYFGWEEVKINNRPVRIATAEKALIDMIQFHKSKYTVDLVLEKLSEYSQTLNLELMTQYVSKMSATTIKTFGHMFDLLGINSDDLYHQAKLSGTNWMLSGDTKFNAKWRLYFDQYFDKYQLAK